MIKKTVIGVCALIAVVAFAFPAFADQSIGFRQYFEEGVKALKEHDDQKALRCFKIAQIYDPSDDELNQYISILEKRTVSLEERPSAPSGESIGYRYYLNKGIDAFQKHDDKKAIHYFNIAIIFNPDSKEADHYLQILGQSTVSASPVNPQSQPLPSLGAQETRQPQGLIQPQELPPPQPVISQPSQAVTQEIPSPSQPVPSVQPQEPQQLTTMPQPPAIESQPVISVTAPKEKMPVTEISLAQISNSGQRNPKLQIDLNSSVILDGKNIQRFLVVDEGFVAVKTIDLDRIKIDALRIGTTFIHIWDDSGRHTFYLEVVFPKSTLEYGAPAATNGIRHSQPFVTTYANDWDSYYNGKNIPDLKRQSYEFSQTLSTKGETPYGFLDASGSYMDFNSVSEFNTYTIGLSQIPLEGTSNFNLRGFDALRYLSPLTMPNTLLRGAFADVDLLDDRVGLSVSHGQQQVPLGFITTGTNQFNNSYVDAAKLTLFPNSNSDRYSFNFATGYGSDRPSYMSNHVYSVEGQHKFNDYLTLNAEEGSDTNHDSSLASLRWQDGNFRSGFNFRNIDKNYATVSGLPSNQGETGAVWTTDGEFKNITESTFVETYRDRLDYNPSDRSALNFDANGHLRVNMNQNLWSDSDLNYVNTAGEQSPERSLGLNERLSRGFGVWNSLRGTVYGGVGYQDSHSSDSDISDYDREDVIAGFQLPLTSHVSTFGNYEYDWLHQPDSGGNSNPNIINAGFEYQKQLTQKFSIHSQLDYRDELGVKGGNNSFLSGEKSVIITSGFAYNPTENLSIFADGNASKILSHIGNPSYDDFDVHVGLRITFGGATYWDPLGTISGIVFKDKNEDGKFVSGDEGIPGVKLKVGDKEVVTDKYGRYSVQIRAKGVQVVPVLDTIPGGLIFSTPQALNVEVLQGRQSKANFGLISQTGIYGIVFVDKNSNGTPNDNDKFIGKVKVILDGKIIQKSDSHGTFYFRKVSPGQHTISIDINTLALNMVPIVKLENKIDVAEGTNYMFNIPVQIKKAEGGE